MALQQAHSEGRLAEMLDITIGEQLDRITARDPFHPALILPQQGIRWSYGEIDLTCSLSRYQALAETSGLVLSKVIDINENTMPTYDFLYESTAGWTNAREVEMFTRATRWLHKACRNGTLAYQILRFDRK